jgi:hypothetical protein
MYYLQHLNSMRKYVVDLVMKMKFSFNKYSQQEYLEIRHLISEINAVLYIRAKAQI